MEKYIPSETVDFSLQLYEKFKDKLDEPARRQFLAEIVEKGGYGAQGYVRKVTGTDIKTLERGRSEIDHPDQKAPLGKGHQRKAGGGRKSIEQLHPEIYDDLRLIIEDSTYGDPSKPLSWTTLSEAKICQALKDDYNLSVSDTKLGWLLEEMGYSRQNNRKMLQTGQPSPNRDKQFRTINETSKAFLKAGDPVISVDTKKKECLGNFRNNGTEYCPKGQPRKVMDHDFLDQKLGKVNPYGVYLLNNNTGFINLGTDHDTSDFASESILRWWYTIGHATFPQARRLYINCDGGGSNRWNGKLWKLDLAKLAEQTGLEIWVSHFPPRTSKWNKIEHRLFCYISKSWQGKPLTDIETVVELIGSTTTREGLRVRCVVDYNKYPRGIKVRDEELEKIDITQFGNDTGWNYIIRGFKH